MAATASEQHGASALKQTFTADRGILVSLSRMRVAIWLSAMMLVGARLASAQNLTIAKTMSCAQAATAAERKWDLPPDLLGAIGKVESGRFDPLTRRVEAWPWTINADGADHVFASLTDAAEAVRTLRARGAKFVDVGCFQVDLFYHPDAFSSVEQGFDAAANADYAARFLTDLRARTGSWEGAVAGYHSLGGPGEAYRRKVMSRWAMVPRANPAASPQGSDPFVVVMSASARAIGVFGP